ncbi:MAG: hypothetical protein VB118_08315 [Oscillospiraceae bacterium]|nr:hypothetical protein [Oscillospiraceae bacterium]
MIKQNNPGQVSECFSDETEDMKNTLYHLRQAFSYIPSGYSEIAEDLKWTIESVEEALDAIRGQLNLIADGGDDNYIDNLYENKNGD